MAIKPRIKKISNYYYIGLYVKNMETGKYQFKRLDKNQKYLNEKDAKKALKKLQSKYDKVPYLTTFDYAYDLYTKLLKETIETLIYLKLLETDQRS